MKTLSCRDVGFDCDAQIQADTDEAVLTQAAEHARTAHGVTVTPEMAETIRPLIHTHDQ